MYYCYIGGPASGTSVPLGPPLYPNVINLLLRKLFMHLCKCFLCYFLAWEQLKAYVMLCYVVDTDSFRGRIYVKIAIMCRL